MTVNPSRTIIEAPPEIAAVFEHWLEGGQSWRETTILEQFLWPYRGHYLLADGWVFWIEKYSDTRDRVMTMPRSLPTRAAREAQEAAIEHDRLARAAVTASTTGEAS